tara:strand:- start:208363 stop:209331 length:969 start_codon:yes stop_codon:yes gene_type:complete
VIDSSLRIVFAGTPEFAAIHLKALIDSKHQLIGVYTQPDRPAGRGKKLLSSPVKKLAIEHQLPLFQPASLRSADAQAQLADLAADVLVVVAYGLILPQVVLDTPTHGCLNVHASLLPRWRGAAPIQRAIEAGDTETGITIMQMDAGLDTGAMLASVRCAIGSDTTAASLHDTLASLGAPLLLQVLNDLPAQQAAAVTQDDALACYANKILKPEAAIDWQGEAAQLDRNIRAFNPFPICYTTLEGERVKVWAAQAASTISTPEPPGTVLQANADGILVNCGNGQLLLKTLQLAGGKPLEAQQLLHARSEQFAPGKQFGAPPSA